MPHRTHTNSHKNTAVIKRVIVIWLDYFTCFNFLFSNLNIKVHIYVYKYIICIYTWYLCNYRKTLPTQATIMSLSKCSCSHPTSLFPGKHYLSFAWLICFKRWFTFNVFYLNNLLLSLEKLSSTHKSITFRWKLPREDKMNSLWFIGFRHLYSF